MDGFKKIVKMKTGGSVNKAIAAYEKKESKSEGKMDMAQDKAMVKKGVRQHESALHKGEPKTELKLKQGGRAKKAKGTVKKFEKASGQYGAKKTAEDKKNIKEAKLFKPKKEVAKFKEGGKACAPSAAKKAKNKPTKLCGGGMPKYNGKDGSYVDVKDPQKLTDQIALEENEADANILPNAYKAVKRIGKQVIKTAKDAFAGQGAVSDAERSNIAKKKGGKVKVKKYADGGAVLSDDEKSWLGGADATDPFIQARMKAAMADKKPVVAAPPAAAPSAAAVARPPVARPNPAMIEDESGRGNVTAAQQLFNQEVPGSGINTTAAPARPVARPVARPAMRRPNPMMIEDESKRGMVTPDQQLYNRAIPGSGNAYQAPNVEGDSGLEYPVKPGFFNATPGQQAAKFNRGAQQRKDVGRKIGDWLGLNKKPGV